MSNQNVSSMRCLQELSRIHIIILAQVCTGKGNGNSKRETTTSTAIIRFFLQRSVLCRRSGPRRSGRSLFFHVQPEPMVPDPLAA